MDEFIIGLSGTLEVNETVNAIKAKLPDVAKKINSGNDNSLLFVGKLDESATITQLQNQLNEISKKLTFEIKSDGLQNVISSLKEVSKVLAQTANSANSNSIVNGINAETKAVESLTSAYGKLAKTSQTTKNGIESSFTTTWRNGAITTTETLTPSGTDSEIKNKTKTVVENFEAQQKAINNAELAADKYRQTLATLSDSVARSTSKDYLSSQEHQTKVLEDITKAQFEIDRLAQTTDKDAFARQKLAVDETISSIRTYISEMQKVEAQTRNAEAAAKQYTEQLERAQQKAIGESASKRITDSEQVAALAAQYDKVTQAITTMQNATAANFASAKIDVDTMLQRYKDMSEEFKRLNELQTKWRTTPVSIIKEQSLSDIRALNNELQRLGLSGASLQGISSQFTTVDEAVATLLTRLEAIGTTDRQGMIKWLDDFNTLNHQIKELTEQDRLQRFTQNAYNAFLMLNEQIEKTAQSIGSSKFSNNPELERFRNEIETIRTAYTALLNSMSQATNQGQDSEAMQRFATQVINATEGIKNQLKQTEAEFKNFEATAKSAFDSVADTGNLASEKRTVIADINTWLRQNTAAAESTQRALRELRAQVENADRATLGNLKLQIKAVKKEAQATGNVGKSFFDQLKSNIAKFTGWYSIGNAIARIRRQIVSAVNDLKDMDTTLTEISKTTGKTVESLESLGQAAYESASNYGRTVQDYLSGVLEMSRAGYTNAEQMAELSLKAQSAGAMTAELANQYLIATDAAYKLHGSEEELTKILDGQNKITDLNAVNMTQLAEATKIAAAQSASAGVSAEEMTAAIGTMIATTQQGGEIAARAWRGKMNAPYYRKIVSA